MSFARGGGGGGGTVAPPVPSDPQSALFAAIQARKAKQEARAAAIARGEVEVVDPREAREKAMKEEERKKRAAKAASRKNAA